MKIALLFLVVNDVKFPEIWEYYFKDNYDKINIYCHVKNPENIKSEWLKKNIIKDLVPTKWGYLTKAMINLMKAALNDKDNLKFILVSDSCLPIKKFSELYNFLSKDDKRVSYINFLKMNYWNINNSNLPENYFKGIKLIKHSQWFCLSRHHIKKLLIDKNLHLFDKVLAGDEHILSLIADSDNIKNFMMTFVNWKFSENIIEDINTKLRFYYHKKETSNKDIYDNKIYKLRKNKSIVGKHPKEYNILTNEELNEINNTESFFFRKFGSESDIIKYYKRFI